MQRNRTVRILEDKDSCPRLALVEGEGEARALVWPGVGAHLRSLHRITLGSGSQTVRQQHPMEAVYYLVSGTATAEDEQTRDTYPLRVGSMVLIDPGTPYRLVAGSKGAELVGGPCPADPALYRHLEVE